MEQNSLGLIRTLVGFDTVSRNSNLDLINFVRTYLADLGITSHLVKSADGSKANLYASVGPNIEGGIVLSGHTDVVPVDGQDWSSKPFVLTERNGKLYGRGTCDMKSFIAVALAKVPQMLASGLQRPLHLALSYDEEIGCLGAPAMIAELINKIPKPAAVIVGEPSNMAPIMAHKGLAVAQTKVIGHEAHSSQTQRGVSAVMTAARLITFLADMAAEFKVNADPACPFEPPYPTIHVGTVSGGTAVNIISRECTFTWDMRVLPEHSVHDILTRFTHYSQGLQAEMQAVAPHASIATELLADAPPLASNGDATASQLAQKITGHTCSGVVPYATEGGLFEAQGLSVVVCGPGSIDQAHQPDEYIEIAQVEACERFMDALIKLQTAQQDQG